MEELHFSSNKGFIKAFSVSWNSETIICKETFNQNKGLEFRFFFFFFSLGEEQNVCGNNSLFSNTISLGESFFSMHETARLLTLGT